MSPFIHSSSLTSSSPDAEYNETRIDAELVQRISTSAKNQSSFLWHVRWEEYDRQSFLDDSVTRYQMMLRLMKENRNQFIVPTYDMVISLFSPSFHTLLG